MAEELICDVPRCGRKFVPGKTGAGGKCGMHDRRARRNSPNADAPGPLRGLGRSEKLNAYVDPSISKRIAKVARVLGVSISEWVSDQLPDALDRDEAKIARMVGAVAKETKDQGEGKDYVTAKTEAEDRGRERRRNGRTGAGTRRRKTADAH